MTLRTGRAALRNLRSLAASLTLLPIAVAQQVRKAAGRECSVSRSCQIPDLRGKFRDLGLAEDRGVFVEVGAFDGDSYSNTSFLADQGWRGVYVEPIPRFCRKISMRHMFNRIEIARCAVMSTGGDLVIKDMGSLSSARDAFIEAHKTFHWSMDAVARAVDTRVKAVPLAVLLADHGVPLDLDLLVVDVEGTERPIVEALLASPWRPKVMIVELVDRNPAFAGNDVALDHQSTREAILRHGYATYYEDDLNSIFVSTSRH